ncbi:MAG: pseudouridine synthase [Phycisphaeraceae bacterium]
MSKPRRNNPTGRKLPKSAGRSTAARKRGGAAPGRLRPRAGTAAAAKGQAPQTYTDAARGQRLQRVLATAGVASRRDCEALVLQGHVSVNGELVTALPAWVDPLRDRIEVDGKPIIGTGKSHRPPQRVYLMLNKPRGVISTTEDPYGRRTVLSLLPDDVFPPGTRLFPIGRLDADSAGLMLLTNDGELANRIAHPRYQIGKEYHVSVAGRVEQSDLERLRKGMFLVERDDEGNPIGTRKAKMEEVAIAGYEHDREHGDRTLLHVILREGQNREIRRMFARLSLKVRRLRRVAIGPVQLKGLAVGEWRPLTPVELRRLRQAVAAADDSA